MIGRHRLIRTVIWRAKSKKTILALTFCVICNSAFANSSIKSITLRSFTNGENLVANCASSRFI